MVFLVYGASFLLALALLYFFHTPWYWHVVSVAIAFVIGLWEPPPAPDLVIGAVFVFLFTWGIGEPLLHRYHRPRTRQPA